MQLMTGGKEEEGRSPTIPPGSRPHWPKDLAQDILSKSPYSISWWLYSSVTKDHLCTIWTLPVSCSILRTLLSFSYLEFSKQNSELLLKKHQGEKWKGWDAAQVVECSPSMHLALGLVPRPTYARGQAWWCKPVTQHSGSGSEADSRSSSQSPVEFEVTLDYMRPYLELKKWNKTGEVAICTVIKMSVLGIVVKHVRTHWDVIVTLRGWDLLVWCGYHSIHQENKVLWSWMKFPSNDFSTLNPKFLTMLVA